MGIADLPDVDEEDWNRYQADQFTASTRPASDALAFESLAASSYAPIARAAAQGTQGMTGTGVLGLPSGGGVLGLPSDRMQGPPSQPIMDGNTDGYGGYGQGANNPTWQPMFMGQEAPVSDLFSRLDGMDGAAPAAPPTPPAAPAAPNPASQAGADLEAFARQQRESGFSRTPVLGPIITGGAQGLAGMAHNLGGSAEAFRQGDYGMAAAGVLKGLSSYGDPMRGMATEAQWPEHVDISGVMPPAFQPAVRQITKDTPVFGGLTNPREVAGLAPELVGPDPIATALMKGAGVAGRLVPRVAEGVAGALVPGVPGASVADAPLGATPIVGVPGRGLSGPTGDVFYSKLSRAIDRLPERGNPEQMRRTLLGQGVKPDEMEWAGINEMLDAYKTTGETVRRSVLQETFSANQVEVREVVRGETPRPRPEGKLPEEELQAMNERLEEEFQRLEALRARRDAGEGWYMDGDQPVLTTVGRQLEDEIAEQQQLVDDLDAEFAVAAQLDTGETGGAMMAQMQAEYRVNALTDDVARLRREMDILPPMSDEYRVAAGAYNDANAELYRAQAELDRANAALDAMTGADPATDPKYPGYGSPRPDDPTYREFEFLVTPTSRVPLVERLPHWPERNVVAHARTIDETLPDGRKALVVLEAQSDIHQHGRSIGYRKQITTEQYQDLKDEAYRIGTESGLEALERWAGGDAYRMAVARSAWVEVVSESSLRSGRAVSARPEIADAHKRADAAWETAYTQTKPLPFQKTWDELVMKRMLRLAAEEGYDVLAWSDAAWQGDVNNLGRSVLQLAYSPRDRKLSGLFTDGQEILADNIFPENMHNLIGRPLAQALLARPAEEGQVLGYATGLSGPLQALSGVRFDLLGDATEQFRVPYDLKLKQIADKLAKPFGGKTQENLWTINAPGSTKGFMGIHGIEITPAMREGAQQGFPLFARGQQGQQGTGAPGLPGGPSPAEQLRGQRFAKNVLARGVAGGMYGAAGGGVLGGVAAGATADEDASAVERVERVLKGVAGGALAGATAGAGLGGPGTVAGMEALYSLALNNKFPRELMQSHPDTVDRVRAVLLAAAQDALLKGEEVVGRIPPLVSGLPRLTDEMRFSSVERQQIEAARIPVPESAYTPDDIQQVLDNIGLLSPQEVIDLVSPNIPPQTLKRTVQAMLADYFNTIPLSRQRAGEFRADIAASRSGGAAAPFQAGATGADLQPMVDRLAAAMGVTGDDVPVVIVKADDPQVPGKHVAVYPPEPGRAAEIVVHPTAINALSAEELAYVLAHEVGHIQDLLTPGFKSPWADTPARIAAGGEGGGVPPPLQPDDDPLPGAEPAGDVIARVLAEMSPTGKAAAQRYGSEVAHRAPWMEGIVAGTEAPPTSGPGGDAARYEDILALTTGDAQAGEEAARALDEAETTGYQPPRKLTKRERERIGNLQALENLPPHERELADRVRDESIDELTRAHGFRTQAEAQEAAKNILPYILQFARGAKPNEPVSEVLLTAGRAAWAQSHFPAYYAEIDYQKALRDPNASPEDVADAKQASDYWDAVRQVLSRYGGEIAPSEVGRAFRSMRDRPSGVVEEIAGGSGAADEAAEAAEAAPRTAREKAAQRMRQEWAKKTRSQNEARSPEEVARQRELRRAQGKRVNGPLEAMGIEWDDVLRRSGDDDYDRATMLAGLADLGIGRRHPDYKKWADQLFADDFLDDAGKVQQFWRDVYRATGRDANRVPFTRFDPNVEGQSYLGSVDTLTKSQAVKLVGDALTKSTDEATRAVREAVRQGKPPGEVSRLKGVVERAYQRAGVGLARWTDEGVAVPGSLTDTGLLKRISDQWPADRRAAAVGRPGTTEDVEKKRQLLGLLDQEMRKELGRGVNWSSDLLSFGTSNVLTTARFVQAATLESLLTAVNEPFQSLLRGDYGGAGRQVQGLARAFGLPGGEEMATLAEGIKAPALVNGLKALRDIGPLEAAGDLSQVAARGAGQIRSDSTGPLSRWASPMHRVSRALSEAFQTGNYMAEVNRLVHAVSKAAPGKGRLPDGTTIEAVLDEATGMPRNPTPQELFGNLPQSIRDAALKRSKTVTEGGEANVFERTIGQAKGLLTKPNASAGERAVGLFANLLFPFVYGLRPMINAGTGVVTSPIKHPKEFMQALRAGDTEGAKYAAKKFALANAFNGFIAYQVMSGNVTGHGPSDPQRRQALLEATDENGDPVWRPDSYRVRNPGGGHTWVKYTSLPGPVPIVSSVMANLYDAYVFEGKSPETGTETASRMGWSMVNSYIDNTYLRDAINLVEALGAPSPGRTAERFVGSTLGRFVPGAGALRTAATVTDPYQRVTTNPLEEVASGIPGARQQLPARVSAYTGEAVEQPLSPATALGGLAGNVYGSPSERNLVARDVADLSRRRMPGEPGAGLRPEVSGPQTFTSGEQARGADLAGTGMRQTGEAIRGAQAAFGRESERQAASLLNSPAYRAMSPEQKAAALNRTFNIARSQAGYAATGAPGVQLTPENRLNRRLQETPRYRGISGPPAEIARRNAEVASAHAAFDGLARQVGPQRARAILAREAPEVLRLIRRHPERSADVRFRTQRGLREELGLGAPGMTGVVVPDYDGGGATAVGVPAGTPNWQALPPSQRRALS